MTTLVKLPRFLLIKQFIESQINSGNWLVGARVPSENELAYTFFGKSNDCAAGSKGIR